MSYMAPQTWSSLPLAPGTPATHTPLTSECVHLKIRQQPKEALLTSDGKEKARKPVDPPPIIQLEVDNPADPPKHFLQSPYLFMCVTLWDATKDQPSSTDGKPIVSGSLVSSLHRLKDINNTDGGFFVFGDVSIKTQGTHRLHFSLFDLRKDTGEVVFLKSIVSEQFKVLLPKDFKGMDESTYLSRAFSDQGVRLRLRKEPRAMLGNGAKRGAYGYGGPHDPSDQQDDGQHTPKRQRFDGGSDEGERGNSWDARAPYSDGKLTSQSSFSLPNPQMSQASHASTYQTMANQPVLPYQQSPYGNVGARSEYLRTPNSSFATDSLSTTLGLGRFSDIQNAYPSYASSYSTAMRPTLTTTFREDMTDDRYRSSIGATHSLPSSFPQTPTHSSHDSLGSSRGHTYSNSPEANRTGYSNGYSLSNMPSTQSGAPAQLVTGHHPAGRYERQDTVFEHMHKRHPQEYAGMTDNPEWSRPVLY